jgi:hypothetical protein
VHMLRQAMRRLAVDAMLRDALGTQARSWWQAHHTVARMHRDYARVLDWAAAQPEPQPSSSLPTHVLPDPAAFARSLLAPFDVHVDILGR